MNFVQIKIIITINSIEEHLAMKLSQFINNSYPQNLYSNNLTGIEETRTSLSLIISTHQSANAKLNEK